METWGLLLVGFIAWFGGIAAALVAGAFDFMARKNTYYLEWARIGGDPYADEIDIEETLHLRGRRCPTFWISVIWCSWQPMLCLSIIAPASFAVGGYGRLEVWGIAAVNVTLMVTANIVHEANRRPGSDVRITNDRLVYWAWVWNLFVLVSMALLTMLRHPAVTG